MGYLGRYYTTDAPIMRRTRDDAQKTLVCEFQGMHYVAEREGSALRIYAVHDENGLPAARIEQTLDQAQVVGSARTPAELERQNRAYWGR